MRFGLRSKSLKGFTLAVKAVQAGVGANPKCASLVFKNGENVVAVDRVGIFAAMLKTFELLCFCIETIEPAIRANPKMIMSVLINRFNSVGAQAAEVLGIVL